MTPVRPTSSTAAFSHPTTHRTNPCSWLTSAACSLWSKVMGTPTEAPKPARLSAERVAHHRPVRHRRGPSLCTRLAIAALVTSSGAAAVEKRNVVIVSGDDYPPGSALAWMADQSAAQWDALVAKNPNFGHLRYKGDPTQGPAATIETTYTGKEDLVDPRKMKGPYHYPIGSAMWGRYPVLVNLFNTSPDVDIACWVDADVVLMNPDTPLPLPEGEELAIFSQDLSAPTTVNSGYFCATSDSRLILTKHMQHYRGFLDHDQEALSALLKANPHLLPYIRIVGHERKDGQGALMGFVLHHPLPDMNHVRCDSRRDTVCHCTVKPESKPSCVADLVRAAKRKPFIPTSPGKITDLFYQIHPAARPGVTNARVNAFTQYSKSYATELAPFYSRSSSWGLVDRLRERLASTAENTSSWIAAFDSQSFPVGNLEKLIQKTHAAADFITFLDSKVLDLENTDLGSYADDGFLLVRNSEEVRRILDKVAHRRLSVCNIYDLYGTDCSAPSPFCMESLTLAQILSWELMVDPGLGIAVVPTSYFDEDARLVLAKQHLFFPTQKPANQSIIAIFHENRSYPRSQ